MIYMTHYVPYNVPVYLIDLSNFQSPYSAIPWVIKIINSCRASVAGRMEHYKYFQVLPSFRYHNSLAFIKYTRALTILRFRLNNDLFLNTLIYF